MKFCEKTRSILNSHHLGEFEDHEQPKELSGNGVYRAAPDFAGPANNFHSLFINL